MRVSVQTNEGRRTIVVFLANCAFVLFSFIAVLLGLYVTVVTQSQSLPHNHPISPFSQYLEVVIVFKLAPNWLRKVE